MFVDIEVIIKLCSSYSGLVTNARKDTDRVLLEAKDKEQQKIQNMNVKADPKSAANSNPKPCKQKIADNTYIDPKNEGTNNPKTTSENTKSTKKSNNNYKLAEPKSDLDSEEIHKGTTFVNMRDQKRDRINAEIKPKKNKAKKPVKKPKTKKKKPEKSDPPPKKNTGVDEDETFCDCLKG